VAQDGKSRNHQLTEQSSRVFGEGRSKSRGRSTKYHCPDLCNKYHHPRKNAPSPPMPLPSAVPIRRVVSAEFCPIVDAKMTMAIANSATTAMPKTAMREDFLMP
jgi:hypothetical protein